MGLFDGMNNPWAPGGQMSPRMPWAKPALSYGWGHGNEFFTPKTQEQIRKEALLQLAVLAAVVVAPALLGAAGGAGAAGAEAAGMGASAEAAGAVAGQGAVAAGGGAAVGSGLAASVGAGAGMAAILQPFLQQGSLQALQRAAQMGEGELNKELKRRSKQCECQPAPKFRSEQWERRHEDCDCNESDEPNEGNSSLHASIRLLERLVELIGKSPILQRELHAASPIRNLHVSANPKLVAMLARITGQYLLTPNNPWEHSIDGGNHFQEPESRESEQRDDESEEPLSYVVFRKSHYRTDKLEKSVHEDAKLQKGWRIIYVDSIQELNDKLRNKKINNILFVSHGSIASATFSIGNNSINSDPNNHGLALIRSMDGVHAKNVILFACYAGKYDIVKGRTIAFGGDDLLQAVAQAFHSNAYGNKGFSYPSKTSDGRQGPFRIFNDPRMGIRFVLSGLPSSETSPWNLQCSPETDARWKGAGLWTKIDSNGMLTDVGSLYVTNDGGFGTLTPQAWRNHPSVKIYLDHFVTLQIHEAWAQGGKVGPEPPYSLLQTNDCTEGWGAMEAAPDRPH